MALPEVTSMLTSWPPLMLVLRPCWESHVRSATSWVLPSCGDASVLPLRSEGKPLDAIDELTTSPAPPSAAPATMTTPPLVFVKADIAGLGPTNAASSEPPSRASLSAGPALNVVAWSEVPDGRYD